MNAYKQHFGPSDLRPHNRPFYIDHDCPRCGDALVPYARDTHSQFACTFCDIILHDWPPETWRALMVLWGF